MRRTAYALGLRFRLHRKDLPGSPDLVFPLRRTVVFVYGCYWHRHPGCRYCYSPKSNVEFWERKFQNNVRRDRRVMEELEGRGWRVVIIWECETTDKEALCEKLEMYLSNEGL